MYSFKLYFGPLPHVQIYFGLRSVQYNRASSLHAGSSIIYMYETQISLCSSLPLQADICRQQDEVGPS